jgi:hypothetical protein
MQRSHMGMITGVEVGLDRLEKVDSMGIVGGQYGEADASWHHGCGPAVRAISGIEGADSE